jgi:hypothetical protein
MNRGTHEVLKQAEEILKRIKGKQQPKIKFKELIFSELNKQKEVKNGTGTKI